MQRKCEGETGGPDPTPSHRCVQGKAITTRIESAKRIEEREIPSVHDGRKTSRQNDGRTSRQEIVKGDKKVAVAGGEVLQFHSSPDSDVKEAMENKDGGVSTSTHGDRDEGLKSSGRGKKGERKEGRMEKARNRKERQQKEENRITIMRIIIRMTINRYYHRQWPAGSFSRRDSG